MFLDNRTKTRKFQDHRSKVEVTGPYFRIFHNCEIGQKSLWTRQLMSRCTQLDDSLHEHVARQPLERIGFQGHRSKMKVIFSLVDQSLPSCFH